jgi:Autotransporter beta-domain
MTRITIRHDQLKFPLGNVRRTAMLLGAVSTVSMNATGALAGSVCLKNEILPTFGWLNTAFTKAVGANGSTVYVVNPTDPLRDTNNVLSPGSAITMTALGAALAANGNALTGLNIVDQNNTGMVFDVSGGGSSVGSGGVAPPVLASIETSNSQAEELIRQRRQLASSTPASMPATQTAQAAAPPNPKAATVRGARAKAAPKPKAGGQATVVQPGPAIATSVDQATPNVGVQFVSQSSVETVGRTTFAPQAAPMRLTASSSSSAAPLTQAFTNSGSNQQSVPDVGAWAQIYLDYEKHANIAPGTAANTTRVQKTVGEIAGTDLTYRRSSSGFNETFQFGLLGGHHDARSKFKDTASTTNASQQDEGGFLGGYATYQANRFSLEAMLKTDFYQHSMKATVNQSVSCPAGQTLFVDNEKDISISTFKHGSVEQKNYTSSLNAAYRFDLGTSSFFEPTAGVRYTYTDYGSGAADFNLQNGDVLRLQAGMRLGTSWNNHGHQWSASVLGLLYRDVMVRGYTLNTEGLSSSALRVDQGKIRALGQLTTKVDVGGGLSYNAQVDVRGGQDLIGFGGRAGLRYEW